MPQSTCATALPQSAPKWQPQQHEFKQRYVFANGGCKGHGTLQRVDREIARPFGIGLWMAARASFQWWPAGAFQYHPRLRL